MLEIDGGNNFRQTMAGVCLILATLVLALAQLVHPGQGEAGFVQTMADNPGRVEAASLLVILSSVLFVPALVGLLRLMRDCGTVLGLIGVSLTLIGAIGHAVWAGFEIVLVWMANSEIDRAQLSAAVDGGPPSGIGFTLILLMFTAGFFLGLIFLVAGLLRSRNVPWWAAVLIAVGPLVEFLPLDNKAVFMTGLALFVVGFSVIGLKLMSGPVAERAPFSGETRVGARPRVQ
ncbi:MAG: hypothetical protein CYG60_25745 [Actinobacteria bacterium]|nr:MAG: hypothetical protein CYG60_25745 [Actinomycetota bacterium]